MKHNYVVINRYPKSQKYEEPTFTDPSEKGVEEGHHFEEIPLEPFPITRQEIIGVINASMLESIDWSRGPAEEIGPGQQGVTYDLVITYLNSTQTSDGHLQIRNFNAYDNYGFVNVLNQKFHSYELQTKMMNQVVNGICKAIMKTHESNAQTVVHYYPPFDLGAITLRSTTNPYEDAGGEKHVKGDDIIEHILEHAEEKHLDIKQKAIHVG